MTRSADFSSLKPATVRRSGSPGPDPTRDTVPVSTPSFGHQPSKSSANAFCPESEPARPAKLPSAPTMQKRKGNCAWSCCRRRLVNDLPTLPDERVDGRDGDKDNTLLTTKAAPPRLPAKMDEANTFSGRIVLRLDDFSMVKLCATEGSNSLS